MSALISKSSQLISAVMIVKNGARTIAKSLKSLLSFDDVVVYDNGSTDGTQKIARGYPNVRLIEGAFEGFGLTKNMAAKHARHDWILIIDSDECLEPELTQAIHSQKLDPQTIYLLNFKAFYKSYQVRYCGWNNQKIRRLYNREHTQFTSDHVHENLIVAGLQTKELHGGSVQHFSYHSVSDFINKVDRYSSLFAEGNTGYSASSKHKIIRASPSKAFLNAAYSFFRTYILKRGFLDGYVGLLIAFSHMSTNFYKYIKLYERRREDDARARDRC